MSPPFEDEQSVRSHHGAHQRSESPTYGQQDKTTWQQIALNLSDDVSKELLHFQDYSSLQAPQPSDPLNKKTGYTEQKLGHLGTDQCAHHDSLHSASELPPGIEDNKNGDANGIGSNCCTQDNHAHDENDKDQVPSNEKLLAIAFFTFFAFALTQLVFALISGSTALLGDVAAMIVDSISYLCNWNAERKKKNYDREQLEQTAGNTLSAEAARICERNRRKMVLKLEIITPVISIVALMLVSAYVVQKSVSVLQLLDSTSAAPNLTIMLIFSSVNLMLDVLNIFCFSKANLGLGNAFHRSPHRPHVNLNMCSAFTHVFADTLRSIAVLFAAALAKLWSGVTPADADAMAALVVSGVIVLSLLPLLKGLWRSAAEFRSILSEERS
jgi:Co/Zn/Cd efflux system component